MFSTFCHSNGGTYRFEVVPERHTVEDAAAQAKRYLKESIVRVGDYATVEGEDGLVYRRFIIEVVEVPHI